MSRVADDLNARAKDAPSESSAVVPWSSGVEGKAPGILARWKASSAARRERRKDRRQAKAYDDARRQHAVALEHWQATNEAIEETLEAARSFFGVAQSELGPGFVLKKSETAYAFIQQVALIEPRRAPGQYVGAYQGVSLRITKGVRYHVGGTRGHYVPGPESPTIIDQGDALITNQRVLFRGPKQSREWAFSKLIGYSPSADRQWMAIQVSNRQKVSGIAYGEGVADMVEHRLQLALATFQDERPHLVEQIEQELQAHQSRKPSLPAQLVS